MTHNETPRDDEFVTIIGTDADEISRTFCAQGLADQQFAIGSATVQPLGVELVEVPFGQVAVLAQSLPPGT